MDRREKLYFTIFLVGVFILLLGLLHSYIEKLLIPSNVTISSYGWIFAIGILFASSGTILILSKRYKIGQKRIIKLNILEVILIIILIVSSAVLGGWLYGQYQKTLLVTTENIQRMEEQLKMMDQMEKDSPFYCKKVIIRDDDIGDSYHLPSLKWISNLSIKKDTKVTFAVIPAILVNNPETIDYLNSLDKKRFEFATHGYEEMYFKGLPYEEQYSIIENGTNIIEVYLYHKPYTFVPPYGSGDVNTTKACKDNGYHSITDMIGYPSYVVNFISDFEWEKDYDPIEHQSFDEFKCSFDRFYDSSDEYYLIYLHDWTFLDGEGKLDKTKTDRFEKVIDYMKSENVQFMKVEEAYEWYIDENSIMTGMENKNRYFIDLGECRYNHTIKFNSPSNWDERIKVKDVTTGEEEIFYEDVFEFDGIKGHLYDIWKA